MKTRLISLVSLVLLFACVTAVAQEPVVPAADPESLFTDPNPQLNANKQVALHIERDLLEANHWDEAGKCITDRYIQHNPHGQIGPRAVVKFFEAVRASPRRFRNT